MKRFGTFAKKVGMTRIFVEKKAVPITLLHVPKAHVIAKEDGLDYSVMKLGITEAKGKVKKPQAKHYERMNLPMFTKVKEFRITKEEAASLGEQVGAEWIDIGSHLDVRSKSIGKGFQGAMKIWHFAGSRASHGASLSHRSIGSTGTRDKIFKQRKMARRMGQDNITIQQQEVVFKDEELNLIGISGTVPGKKGTWVQITKPAKARA